MLDINKRYVLDEHDQKVAVIVDVDTFNKIEQLLEDYALVELMKQNELQDRLSLSDAKKFYDNLEKAD